MATEGIRFTDGTDVAHAAHFILGSNMTLDKDATGRPRINAPDAGGGTVSGTGTEKYVTMWQAGGADIEDSAIIQDGSANIRIGTDPGGTNKLRVGGNITVGGGASEGRIVKRNVGSDEAFLEVYQTTTFYGALYYDVQATSASDYWTFYSEGDSVNPALRIGTESIFYSDPGGTEEVRIGGSLRVGGAAGNDHFVVTGAYIAVQKTGGSAQYIVSGDAGQYRQVSFQTSSSQRWSIFANTTAEGGSNAGSDLAIARHTDAGAYIDEPVQVVRSTGNITLCGSAGDVIISSDPGGSETLRVGGQIRCSGMEATGNLRITSTLPQYLMIESGVDANQARWAMRANSSVFYMLTMDSVSADGEQFLSVTRTSTVVDEVTIPNGVFIVAEDFQMGDNTGPKLRKTTDSGTNQIEYDDGSTNAAMLCAVVVSTSNPSGDYPDGTIWFKIAP